MRQRNDLTIRECGERGSILVISMATARSNLKSQGWSRQRATLEDLRRDAPLDGLLSAARGTSSGERVLVPYETPKAPDALLAPCMDSENSRCTDTDFDSRLDAWVPWRQCATGRRSGWNFHGARQRGEFPGRSP